MSSNRVQLRMKEIANLAQLKTLGKQTIGDAINESLKVAINDFNDQNSFKMVDEKPTDTVVQTVDPIVQPIEPIEPIQTGLKKVLIKDYPTEPTLEKIVAPTYTIESKTIETGIIEANTGYYYTITTANPNPIMYMCYGIVCKDHIKYDTHVVEYSDNSICIEIKNNDNVDHLISISYIAYF